MSIQDAKALYTKLLADSSFRKKLERTSNSQQRYQILKEAGFSCTFQELKIAKNKLLQSSTSDRKLTSEEEDMVQGGNYPKFLLDSWDYFLCNF